MSDDNTKKDEEYIPYSARRWTDIPKFFPIKGQPISAEKKEQARKDLCAFILRDYERKINAAETEEEKNLLIAKMENFKNKNNL